MASKKKKKTFGPDKTNQDCQQAQDPASIPGTLLGTPVYRRTLGTGQCIALAPFTTTFLELPSASPKPSLNRPIHSLDPELSAAWDKSPKCTHALPC